MDIFANYHSAVLAMFAAGVVLFIQFLVADITGFLGTKTPGIPVAANHDDFLFRATRAYSNMNETIAVFIIFMTVGILAQIDPVWLSRLAWVYVAARIAYGLCYWMKLGLGRTLCFVAVLLSLLGLGITVGIGLL